MSGKTYKKVMAQLDKQGTLHPDVHMLFNSAVEEPLKVGLKTWGDKGRKAMKSEMRQLHLRDIFGTRHCHELSAKERAEFLQSHMFIKLKRYVNIKGRAVDGGNKK